MGRHKSQEEADVLTNAMHAFWGSSYSGVSIKDLERATGLKSGSLYHSYQDKEGIFRAAVKHYNRTVLQPRIERFVNTKKGVKGLKQLFLSLLQSTECDSSGCLLINAAVEFGAEPSAVSEEVREGIELMRIAIKKVVLHDAKKGALRPGVDAEATAARLFIFYQGLLVFLRSGQNMAVVRRLISAEVDQLLT